ncbi:MarR family winged helix-turn-helix transcriptional regulator [Weissella kandleri]|uniref:MarR family winged helix-turn-helix transcriptional regulator n=1 Tax=Weissella kandleri TaxID=1616 RepID=UPI00387E3F93
MENKNAFEEANAELVDVFNNAMWIEEAVLGDSAYNDLTLKDMHIIAAIGDEKQVTASRLAEIIRVTPSTMTSAIDKLVRKNYVQRERDQDDRRVVLITLTESGQKVCEMHAEFHRKLTKALLSSSDETANQNIQTALGRLQQYLRNLNQ